MINKGPLLFLLFGTLSRLHAGEEAPKTIAERMAYERHRKQIAAAHIRKETVWKVTDSTRSRQRVTLFDRRGNPVEETTYGTDAIPALRVSTYYSPEDVPFLRTVVAGGDTERTTFTYLAPRLIATATDFAPSGYARDRIEYTYSDTLIVAAKFDSMDALIYRIFYRYPGGTADGAMAEACHEDASGKQIFRVRYAYLGGLRTAKEVFDARDRLDYTFHYTYTKEGDLASITKQLAGGAIGSRREYHYRPDGTLHRITEHDGNGVLRLSLEYEHERYNDGE